MLLPNQILTLGLLTTAAIAFPFTSRSASPTSSNYNIKANSTSVDPVLASLIAASATETSDMSTCPLTHPTKQCCASITEMAGDITKELGELVPILSEVKVSSILSLQCRSMDPNSPNESCTDDVVCCTGMEDTESAIFKTCKTWDEAITSKKKALDHNNSRQQQYSSAVAATPTSNLHRPTP
ncbi:uncharacterized protein ATNIH1004_009801 [Aspergillus tanneri]|uniref:Hydrophobin n=1 Tax=Aspergillus tanneri TaxID=1220188 RepID=A0A5M9MEW1_9EURO|nr:uncharacterized protein ATNIH1004_009801 [Aspergillus tanneri]KAA8643039.1 hypothetical protein ATNIH1004_009801 [Aspergillus tanneri]